MLGKTFEEFRNNELTRWRMYSIHYKKYERNIFLNERTFDDLQIKISSNLQELCYNYFSKFSFFDVRNIQ